MKIEFAPFDAIGIGRITQLINKTNQFNLTTRRYTRSEVENMSTSSDFVTFQIRLLDRFGDNGIISIVIARHKDASYEIDTWLMSCRVLGRRVEEAVIAELVRHSRANGVNILEGKYIPTAKNTLVRDHYHKLGFARAGGADDDQIWRLDISGYEEPSLPFEFLRNDKA
jgi:FkbH-like protein